MKYFISMTLLVCMTCVSYGQNDTIKLANLQINDQPSIRIDPQTGKPNDKLPKLFHFSVTSNTLNNAAFVRIKLGTSEQSPSDVIDTLATIIDVKGMKQLKLGIFADPIMEMPASPVKVTSYFPKYILQIPVELSAAKEQLWRRAEVTIIDIQRIESKPVVLIRTL